MRLRSLTAALAALALGLGVMSGAHALDDDPAEAQSTTTADTTDATDSTDAAAVDALRDAEALLDADPATEPDADPGALSAPAGAIEDDDVTLALRDLALQSDGLSARQQDRASRLLARPGGTRVKCGAATCVHWTTTGGSATRTSFAKKVLSTMELVHRTFVRAGYRAPMTDGNRGGNAKRDIYLKNTGSQGYYGYCTTDDQDSGAPWRRPAYCVLDNNFREFTTPTITATESMRVTAAHEYFHAVQFGYDWGEDAWLMESTATWVEDEMFDAVNDSRQYLATGQSRRPRTSLDRSAYSYYGQWVFFRYLTERITGSKGGLPTLVRDVWRAAQFNDADHDRYSLQAIRSVLAGKKRGLGTTYAAFAAANLRPAQAYAEGAAYPSPKPFAQATLSRASRSSGWRSERLDHLTSSTALFKRDGGLGTGWKLKLTADMAPKVRGSRAVVTVFRTNGGAKVKNLPLNAEGNGQRTVSFGGSVARVAVTLVNASTRTTCGPPSRKGFGAFACAGKPTDQDLKQRVRARAVR